MIAARLRTNLLLSDCSTTFAVLYVWSASGLPSGLVPLRLAVPLFRSVFVCASVPSMSFVVGAGSRVRRDAWPTRHRVRWAGTRLERDLEACSATGSMLPIGARRRYAREASLDYYMAWDVAWTAPTGVRTPGGGIIS